MRTRGKLFILSGPSGSGKSTVIDHLLSRCAIRLEVSPSVTTRPPRPDDLHAKRYIHLGDAEFHPRGQPPALARALHRLVREIDRPQRHQIMIAQPVLLQDRVQWLRAEIPLDLIVPVVFSCIFHAPSSANTVRRIFPIEE